MTNEWGNWLSRLDEWTHFFTGTFAQERKTADAVARSFGGFVDSLRGYPGIETRAFVVVEGDRSTRLHLHALAVLHWDGKILSPPSTLPDRRGRLREARSLVAWRRWAESRGRCRCDPIHGTATGAAFYVAKYLCKEREPRFYFLPDEAWGSNLQA